MGGFKTGTSVNTVTRRRQKVKLQYIRIKAGPQRDKYVHDIVCRAKIIGRREAWEREHPGVPVPENEFYSLDYETVDHDNGDSLDNSPVNLLPTTRAENTRRQRLRVEAQKSEKAANKLKARAARAGGESSDVPF